MTVGTGFGLISDRGVPNRRLLVSIGYESKLNDQQPDERAKRSDAAANPEPAKASEEIPEKSKPEPVTQAEEIEESPESEAKPEEIPESEAKPEEAAESEA